MSRRPFPLFAPALWGAACGAVLGALRTREATLQLLGKNRALQDAGFLPLPGNGHWETLASWAPSAAGGLFFGLSLGLGAGTLLGLWARCTGGLPGRPGRLLPWATLAVPLWALAGGDPGLAAALAASAAGAVWSQGAGGQMDARSALLRALVLAPLLTALIPWATAAEGPFTRLRDGVLLGSPAGQAVNTFYYRWTLYPAHVLKPLAGLSQPAVAVSGQISEENRDRFCRQGLRLGLLCVDEGEAADVRAFPDRGTGAVELLHGRTRVAWPEDPDAQGEAWNRLSAASDRGRPLRLATYWALFLGCPLALCWGFSSLALAAGALVGDRWRLFGSLGAAVLLAASLGAAGRIDPALHAARSRLIIESPDRAEVMAALGSSTAAVRLYGARAAGAARLEADLLVDALSDPLLNVRTGAAEALGAVGGPRARELLLEVVRSPEEWYVKERAYASLWRLGWRGR
ncbi:MAG: HEAT repeat domain-containing protein [Deferrisomatales bacterium]|nr:HEAT repeat domain-containing protein [Deferrisomatales bacterium]